MLHLKIVIHVPEVGEIALFPKVYWENTVSIQIPVTEERKWRPVLERLLSESGTPVQWMGGSMIFALNSTIRNLNESRVFLQGAIPRITEVTLG